MASGKNNQGNKRRRVGNTTIRTKQSVISNLTKVPVSIVRVGSLEEEDVMCHVKEAIDDVGGARSVVENGDLVLIKPNFVAPRRSNTGTTTNLAIIREVINEVKDLGGQPIIGESAARREFDPEIVFKVIGIREFAKKEGVKFVDLEKEERVTIEVPRGVLFKKIKFPRVVVESDVLISIPKLKTHCWTTVTLAMKSLWGLLPMVERTRGHFFGLDQGIVDVNKVVEQDLIVVDGTVGMDGDRSPSRGNPVELGVLVAGKDAVAVDITCCKIMGVDPDSVKHLKIALQQIERPEVIEIIGEPIDDVRKPFRTPRVGLSEKVFWQNVYRIDHILTKIICRPVSVFPFALSMVGTLPKVDQKRCDACGVCREICPTDAIDVKSVAKINRFTCAKCVCLQCVEACPVGAIEFVKSRWLRWIH